MIHLQAAESHNSKDVGNLIILIVNCRFDFLAIEFRIIDNCHLQKSTESTVHRTWIGGLSQIIEWLYNEKGRESAHDKTDLRLGRLKQFTQAEL